jgi:hypothetical protein
VEIAVVTAAHALGPCLLFAEERARTVDKLVSGDTGCDQV